MRVIVTCGPSYEPVDQVRRLTNFSTSRLGITLANAFAAAGWEVHCLKGEQATCADPLRCHATQSFSTNADLATRLEALGRAEKFDAVFHAAALSDFTVERVRDENGAAQTEAKISSRTGKLILELAPAVKVLPKLRSWFPQARIVGWKYELNGSSEDAFARAWAQLRASGTDACVLNGAAYGQGFAVCEAGGSVTRCADASELAAALIRSLERK